MVYYEGKCISKEEFEQLRKRNAEALCLKQGKVYHEGKCYSKDQYDQMMYALQAANAVCGRTGQKFDKTKGKCTGTATQQPVTYNLNRETDSLRRGLRQKPKVNYKDLATKGKK